MNIVKESDKLPCTFCGKREVYIPAQRCINCRELESAILRDPQAAKKILARHGL